MYDILTRPGPELTTEEREEVKKVARQVLARLNSGQAVDPSEYYFRTAMRFETGAPELAWMNRRATSLRAMTQDAAFACGP